MGPPDCLIGFCAWIGFNSFAELGVQQMLQAINQANKRDIKRAQVRAAQFTASMSESNSSDIRPADESLARGHEGAAHGQTKAHRVPYSEEGTPQAARPGNSQQRVTLQ